MNKAMIFAAGSLVGAVAGASICYFVTKKRTEARINEEIEKFKSEYKSLKAFPHFEENSESNVNPPDKRPDLTTHSSIEGGPVKVERVAYNKVAANYKKGDDILENSASDDEKAMAGKTPEDILSEAEHPVDADEEGVVIITKEQFEEDDEFDDVYLSWYAGNNVLIDQYDDVIEDARPLVGDILNELYTEISQVEDVSDGLVFIRNNDTGINYEIDVIMDSYEAVD